MSILQTKNLVKSFGGVHATDHVSVTFDPGKITALIGPNGSGKSTLINELTGLVAMDGGEIILSESVHLTKIAPHDIALYGITRTFQNVRLIEQLSVLDNILLVLTERGVFASLFENHTKFHLDQAEDVLKKVNLWEKRNELVENLSYGQRKLLEIARALSMRAQIYFFDEPFAGLFPEMVKTVSGVLEDLRSSGVAVVLVEHNMDLIRELADFCYVLDAGKVIAEGTPQQVLAEPHVIEAYLGK